MRISELKRKLQQTSEDRELAVATLLAAAGEIYSFGCDSEVLYRELRKLNSVVAECDTKVENLCNTISEMARSFKKRDR
jgi:hypothetical protein